MLKGKRIDSPLDLDANVIAYRFVDADGKEPVIAMWSLGGNRQIASPWPNPTLTDLMGQERKISGDRIQLRDGAAVFVRP